MGVSPVFSLVLAPCTSRVRIAVVRYMHGGATMYMKSSDQGSGSGGVAGVWHSRRRTWLVALWLLFAATQLERSAAASLASSSAACPGLARKLPARGTRVTAKSEAREKCRR